MPLKRGVVQGTKRHFALRFSIRIPLPKKEYLLFRFPMGNQRRGGIFMQKKKKNIIDVKTLTIGAMLCAISIVVGIFCKNFLNFGEGLFRITFENFPIILSGILFGPLVGGLVGAASDILSYILSTQSFAISPIVTLGAISVGVVSGAVSRLTREKKPLWRIILSTSLAHLIGSLTIKSIGLYAYYGVAVLYRIPTYLLICTLECIIIHLLFQNKVFLKISEDERTKK